MCHKTRKNIRLMFFEILEYLHSSISTALYKYLQY